MAFSTQYGLSDEELQENKNCRRSHQEHWVVTMRHYNCSAFNGYHRTPSEYSEMVCHFCGRMWRTKANYVKHFPDGDYVTAAEKRSITETYETSLAQEDFTRSW